MPSSSDSPSHDHIGGDQIHGDKVGRDKITYHAPRGAPTPDDAYQWLLTLVEQIERAPLPDHRVAQSEQRALAVFQRLNATADEANAWLRWLQRSLVCGVMALLPAHPLPAIDDVSAAREYGAGILWPLVGSVEPRYRTGFGLLLARLDADSAAQVVDMAARNYDDAKTPEQQARIQEQFLVTLSAPPAVEALGVVLAYLSNLHVWRRGVRAWERSRRSGPHAPVDPLGTVALPPSITDTGTSSPTPPAAPPAPLPRRSANLVRTRAGLLSIPIGAEQWQEEWRWHDERFGAHGLQHDPVPYWCYVRGGHYRVGGWEDDDPLAELALQPFWIARVPITVAQYAPFVQVGYTDAAQRWWTANGWAWKEKQKRTQPWIWGHENFNAPNQPVSGVTWYEATAFCAWLHQQPGGALPDGYELRLPTEAEWEAAAAYDMDMHRHSYPWGDDAPTLEWEIYGRPLKQGPPTIGSCPPGAAACGALDMVGTVWECAANSYDGYPTTSNTVEKDFTDDVRDVPWRGGSWYNDSTSRCRTRLRGYPSGRGGDNGFRVVVAPRAH